MSVARLSPLKWSSRTAPVILAAKIAMLNATGRNELGDVGVLTSGEGEGGLKLGRGTAERDSEEHQHGATPDRFMAHVAMQEADENG